MASLVNTFPQEFLEVLHHSLQYVGRNCCHFFSDVLFQIHRGFFSHTLLLRYPQRKKYCDYGHTFWWILKCRRNIDWVTTTESLFFESRLHSETPMLFRPALNGNWNALSFDRRALNSPRQRFHSKLCYQIVRYFCRTLYMSLKCYLRFFPYFDGLSQKQHR